MHACGVCVRTIPVIGLRNANLSLLDLGYGYAAYVPISTRVETRKYRGQRDDRSALRADAWKLQLQEAALRAGAAGSAECRRRCAASRLISSMDPGS